MNPFDKELVQLRDVFAQADRALRDASPKCPTCGKPTAGIVQRGHTREQAGLCVCRMEEFCRRYGVTR